MPPEKDDPEPDENPPSTSPHTPSSRIAAPSGTRIIALAGMPGAGKSSVGARLASLLNLPFLDADAEIARQTGSSVRSIFQKRGETSFRQIERRVVSSLLQKSPLVIALGGGALSDPLTRNTLLKRSKIVLLHAHHNILLRRALSDRFVVRPLLHKHPRSRFLSLLKRRLPHFARIPLRVSCAPPTHTVARAVARVVS